jgi:hypothetical protein
VAATVSGRGKQEQVRTAVNQLIAKLVTPQSGHPNMELQEDLKKDKLSGRWVAVVVVSQKTFALKNVVKLKQLITTTKLTLLGAVVTVKFKQMELHSRVLAGNSVKYQKILVFSNVQL